jgi:beta-lactamase class A
MSRPRLAALALLCLAVLAACAPTPSQPAAALPPTAPPPTAPPQPAATPRPTVAPTATPAPTFAEGSSIAGVDVSGLSFEKASALVEQRLAGAPGAITIEAGPVSQQLEPEAIDLSIPVGDLLAQARAAFERGSPAEVPATVSFDEKALRERLSGLADEVVAGSSISVLTSTDVLSRSFAYAPGLALDVDAAVEQIGAELSAATASGKPVERIALELSRSEAPPRVPLERLREELTALADELPGVVGLHLIDLETGESIGLNDRSVFAGASTIKTAIMLNLYINLSTFTERQSFWLNEMIRYSDNLSANDLLAASVGGQGTEYAFEGADAMSTMLQEELGLRHTYLYVPYETTDYIKLYKPKFRCGPAGPVGEKPYTEMGACLRAEPASMARLYLLIDQCAGGEGELLDTFERLSPKRCQEMLDWLARNADKTRMVAGIPTGVRVEHKSGWIEDMQADNGIVRSPGGDYILSIYYFKPLDGKRDYWTDEEMAPTVAAFSRLVYTAFNPVEQAPAR